MRKKNIQSNRMTTIDEHLSTKRSTLPGAGKGLFTKVFIAKGTIITEYKGKISTYNDADHDGGNNAYIYYINKNYVIDAKDHPDAWAHYANDAMGLTRVKGITNNAEYIEKGKRVFIAAAKNIEAGAEILVAYGKEYWDVIKENAES